MMELREHVQRFIDDFCRQRKLFPIPQARLIQNTSQRKNCGDFNIFVKQPTFDVLKPYFDDMCQELTDVSLQWRTPLEKVIYSAKSAYLELFLKRPEAFRIVFSDVSQNIIPKLSEPRKLLVVYAPDQPEFDLKRSNMLQEYIEIQYTGAGYHVETIKQFSPLNIDSDYSHLEYFDKAKMAFDLRKFLEDKNMTHEFDSNIGYCYLDSQAIPIAEGLRQLIEGNTNIMLCHLVPQNKGYVQQQAALVLEIFGFVPKKQMFIIHGGTESRESGIDEYEKEIFDYVTLSLQQRHNTEEPGWAESIQILTQTKIKFDILTSRQTARLKIPTKEKGGTYDGKGGIFVQYTCARLAVLLRNYDKCITEGKYTTPKCSEIQLSDLNLDSLDLDQDWALWRVCYRCNHILQRCAGIPIVDNLPAKADLLSHSVCEILIALCVEFSTYYSKVRILVENQPHLMETLKCRVYLLITVQNLLHKGLSMLGLGPVQRM